MKVSFEVPQVIRISDYHLVDDITDMLYDLGIEDIEVDEKDVDGGYYAVIYKKGHKLSHKEIIKMINEYDNRK